MEAGVMLYAFDDTGMPADMHKRIKRVGGMRHALETVVPALATTADGTTRDGQSYTYIADADDGPRFLKTLHERCWLCGFGWIEVDVVGRLRERSIADRIRIIRMSEWSKP